MGNLSSPVGGGLPQVRAVIMERMRRTSTPNASSSHRTSFTLTTEVTCCGSQCVLGPHICFAFIQDEIEKQIRPDAKQRAVVLNFVRNDVHELNFTSKVQYPACMWPRRSVVRLIPHIVNTGVGRIDPALSRSCY